MMIELKTKRRWIVSVLEVVAESQDTRAVARATIKHSGVRKLSTGEKSFASRLKAATRPLASTGR